MNGRTRSLFSLKYSSVFFLVRPFFNSNSNKKHKMDEHDINEFIEILKKYVRITLIIWTAIFIISILIVIYFYH